MNLPFRYNYDWKIEEAQKNILRTHTTAVSARMLYKLAQQVSGEQSRCRDQICSGPAPSYVVNIQLLSDKLY